jgi:membrane associated rhomboid family serine protease
MAFCKYPRRPAPYWHYLNTDLSVEGDVSEARMEKWLLVLTAKQIPHLFLSRARIFGMDSKKPGLYVPAEYAGPALEEISAFENEGPRIFPSPGRTNNATGVLLVTLLLFLWHGLRFHWFHPTLPEPPFPFNPAAWLPLFALDKAHLPDWADLTRCFTALTLHADAQHLFSNLVFGLFFLVPLCRRAGQGLGLCLSIFGGALGNFCNAIACAIPLWPALRSGPGGTLSLGFSTAIFSALGALCLLNTADVLRQGRISGQTSDPIFGQTPGAASDQPQAFGITKMEGRELLRKSALPLGAGLALLGFLGGGGEVRTDYAAHISGFVCGLLLALPALSADARLRELPAETAALIQLLLLLALLFFMAGTWILALQSLA